MKRLLFFIFSLALVVPAKAQHEADVWCYGNGYDFRVIRDPSTIPSGIKVSFTPSGPVRPAQEFNFTYIKGSVGWVGLGSASICDAQGRLLFACNGTVLRDREGRTLPHGDLNVVGEVRDGWPWGIVSEQATLIVPGPNGLYYVFYWRQPNALRYAVVDMRLNGGYGDVTAERDVAVTRTNMPRVTAIRHANNRDFWVLSRDEDTRGFQAFRVSAQGVAPEPVRSLTGTARFPSPQDNGLKAAPNGQQLACGVQYYAADGTARSGVATYTFDPATGKVAGEQIIYATLIPNYLEVQGPGTRPDGGGLIFSTSFSPDSRRLYVSEYPRSATNPQPRGTEIYQFDLTRPTPADIAQSRYWVSSVPTLTNDYPTTRTTSLQLAPDGTLWADCFYRRNINPALNVYRALSSGIIRWPNVMGAGCGFEPEAYTYLAGQYTTYLPNLITTLLYAAPVLNAAVGCPTDSVAFWASSAGPATGLRWDFGDPGSGAANTAQGHQTVAHRYARAGRYLVSLTLPTGLVLRREVEIVPSAADFTRANIFTPNGDGLNDAFVPVRGPLAGYHLRVFSRWGRLVYESADPAQPWTGTGQAAGDYFYQLDYQNCENQPRQQRGTVLLSR